jgi:AcrR family transcriptional regulator
MSPDALAEPAARGRRERRKADTRRRLLAAARALFVERGYDATRPQDIARAADVAAGTFYVHFADKRDVFLAFSDAVTNDLLAGIRERAAAAGGFEELLHGALEGLFEYSAANPGVLFAVSADAAVGAADLPSGTSLRERLAQLLARSLRRGMLRGEVPRDLDPVLVAHGIVGFVHHALVHAAREGLDRDEVLATLKRFCGRALVQGPAEAGARGRARRREAGA